MTTPSANAPTITIKVSTKKKEGDNPFYTEVGAGWVKTGKHGQYISVSLHPNVSISQGVVMTKSKDDEFPLTDERLDVLVVGKSGNKPIYHKIGAAFRLSSGNYSLALPEGVSLVNGFMLGQSKKEQ